VAPVRAAADTLRRRQARFRRELGAGEATLSLACDGEEPVGFAIVRVRDGEATFETGEVVAELESMAVAPHRRGEGVGSALMRHVHERLAREGVGFMSLTVLAGNEEAAAFYRRFGMAATHARMLGPVDRGGA
ncbi:MAG: GNAT family N-acetyltransferase, partial [Actinomycetota bacterium]|nr:GNAT family N-acetyltransferase [Actinomycetota bacterium]